MPARLLLLCLLFRSSWLTVEAAGGLAPPQCCIAGADGQPWPCRSAWLWRSQRVVSSPTPSATARVESGGDGRRCCQRARRDRRLIGAAETAHFGVALIAHSAFSADAGRGRSCRIMCAPRAGEGPLFERGGSTTGFGLAFARSLCVVTLAISRCARAVRADAPSLCWSGRTWPRLFLDRCAED